ncbi:MAG: SET domain-containing protein [Melioribacteraceae bacterium]
MHNSNLLFEKYIEVKESPVHGKGLFAKIDIPEEEVLSIIKGEFIDGFECVRREEEDNSYIFWHCDDNYIDVKNESMKFINHDCDPNCYVNDGDETTLTLISIRQIKSGEEISIDYDYEEIYLTCNCFSCQTKKAV